MAELFVVPFVPFLLNLQTRQFSPGCRLAIARSSVPVHKNLPKLPSSPNTHPSPTANPVALVFALLLGLLLGIPNCFALVYTSVDQLALTLPLSAAVGQSYAVGWDGSKYIAVGEYILTSADGTSWAERAYYPAGSWMKSSIAIKPGRYVAGGQNDSAHWSSDGLTWTVATLPNAAAPGAGHFRVASDGQMFVGIPAAGNAVFTSTDGVTWSTIPSSGYSNGSPSRIRYVNGAFHVMGQSSSVFASSSNAGQSWSNHTVGTGFRMADISYNNGLYVAVGSNAATNKAQIFTSSNLVNWSEVAAPFGTLPMSAVSTNGTGFIATAPNGGVGGTVVLTSPDGLSWTTAITNTAPAGAVDVVVANSLTLLAVIATNAPPAVPQYTVTTTVSGGNGAAGLTPQTVYAGVSAVITVSPAPGYTVNTVTASGCSVTRVGNTITTSAISSNCSIVVTFHVACNLDIDQDNAVLPLTDGLLILRRMLGFGNGALISQAYNPNGLRTAAIDIANAIDPMISGKTLDIDGNNTVVASSDGLVLLRALFGFGGTAVTTDVLGPAPRTRGDWPSIRAYLATECGLTNLAP